MTMTIRTIRHCYIWLTGHAIILLCDMGLGSVGMRLWFWATTGRREKYFFDSKDT